MTIKLQKQYQFSVFSKASKVSG